MLQFQMLFGGGRDERSGGGSIGALAAIILAPIAALIIQLAVSRGREYLADTTGAALTGDPEGLAQALERLEAANQEQGILGRLARRAGRRRAGAAPAANPAFAHLYIVNPLAGRSSAACSRPIRRSPSGSSACGRCGPGRSASAEGLRNARTRGAADPAPGIRQPAACATTG